MAKAAPTPVDVLDFQFKLRCRLKIFRSESNEAFNKPCNVIATASRYGLVFVGNCNPYFQVIQVEDLEKYTVKDGEISQYSRRNVALPSKPLHLAVNCDSTKLSVVCDSEGCVKAFVYDIPSFLRQVVSTTHDIRLSPIPGVTVLEIMWNPAIPSIFTACKSDGSLGLYELKDSGLEINELPSSAGASCMCWSPKGKQIAVGGRDGKIIQYKPDLKVAKVVNSPPLEGNQSVVALQWISNYQFVAVYRLADVEAVSSLLIVDAPKIGDVCYTNYEDVCYSYGVARPHQFYMVHQPAWNVLIVASSNSMEVGVLGLEKDQWMQWILSDSARAELPLSSTKQDTLPIGLAFNISSIRAVPWGENVLPPAPYLLLLSHHGVLCCFSVINIKQGSPAICQSPEQLPDKSGLKYFCSNEPDAPAETTKPLKENVQDIIAEPIVESQIIVTPTPSVGNKSFFGPSVTITKITQTPPATPTSNDSQITPKLPLFNFKSAPAPPKSTPALEPVTPPKAAPSQISEMNVLNEDTENLLAQMVKEECLSLETELKVLLHRGYGFKVDFGGDAEATEIVEKTNGFQTFLNEVTETSWSQAAEIHGLKQNLMQMWVWYEEARSRFSMYKDPKLMVLMRAQPLDPASERQLNEIKQLLFYLQSQMNQANIALDEQWEAFQDSCRKTNNYRIPTIEAIYQLMVKQNATLQRQTYILKDISSRMRRRNRNNHIPHLLVSLDNADKLEEQLKNLHLEPKDLFQLQHQRILDRQKLLSTGKTDKLRNLLLKRKIVHVSVTKPQLSNSKLQLSTLLGAPFSPIAPNKKFPPQKQLDFVQSTPRPEVSSQAEIGNFQLTAPPTKTDPSMSLTKTLFTSDAVANSTKEAPLELVKPTNGNVNVSKPISFSTSSSIFTEGKTSPGSAFVPTTQNITFGIKNSRFGGSAPMAKISTTEQKPTFSFNTSVFDSAVKTLPPSTSTQKPSLFSTKPPVAAVPTATFSFAAPNTPTSTFGRFTFSSPQNNSTKSTGASLKPNIGASSPSPQMATKITVQDKNENSPQNPTSKSTSIFNVYPGASPNDTQSSPFSNTASIFSTTSAPNKTFGSSPLSNESNSKVTSSSLPTQSVSIFSAVAPVTQEMSNVSSTSTEKARPAPPSSVLPETKTMPPQTSIFSGLGAPTTRQSIFGSKSNNTIFGMQPPSPSAAKSATSVFGIPVSNTASFGKNDGVSIFGTPTPTSSGATTIFNTPTSEATIFNSPSINTSILGADYDASSKPSNLEAPSSTSTVFARVATSVPPSTTVTILEIPSPSPSVIGTNSADLSSTTTTPSTITAASVAQPITTSVFTLPLSSTTVFGSSSTIFGAPSGTSIFGSSTASFGPPSSSTTNFAAATTSTTLIKTPSNLDTTSSNTTVFGAPSPTTAFQAPSNSATIFGKPLTTPSFGTPTTSATVLEVPTYGKETAATTSSIFGAPTTQTSIFGAPANTSVFSSSGSAFGTPKTTASLFGAGSIFGPITTSLSTFGGGGGFGTSSAPTFGQVSTFGSSSIFSTPAATSSGSIFGGTAGGATSSFGNPVTSSVFGTPTSSAPFGEQPSVFGAPAGPFGTTSSSFGSSQANSFSFAAPANTAVVSNSDGTTFGFNQPSFGGFGTNTNASSFSFGGLNVGSAAPTTTGFGSSFTQNQNPFGRPSAQEQKSPFDSGSLFGTPVSTSSSSAFGGTLPFSKQSPAFGAPATFGSSGSFGQQQSPSFGQGGFGSSVFGGSPQPGGPFSGGSQSVAQSGFGAAPVFPKSSGFGAFGSTSPGGFGSPAAFGSSPAFAAPSNFGSPSKVFGGGAPPTDAFGSSSPQNSTFANLANQPTLGFGNLAQHNQPPTSQSTAFSGGSSFSSWR